MKVTQVFPQKSDLELEEIISTAHHQKDWLHQQSIDDLIEYADVLQKEWQKSAPAQARLYLKNISEFLSKKSLNENLSIALRGDPRVLDHFSSLGSSKYMFHAQPRGVVAHWLAGNVAVLGLFSIFSALITKNISIVKASSRGWEQLIELLDTIKQISTPNIKGEDIAKAISVILIDRDNKAAHQKLSFSADVRIAWGGKEAIQTIQALPKKTHTQDIIMGPKYSYAAIDNRSFKDNKQKLAQKLAVDMSVFDQYACSSPHTVFIEGTLKNANEFGQLLAKNLDIVNRTLIPKNHDPAKTTDIISKRVEYLTKGTVFQSKDTSWTVIVTDEEGLAEACFSRVMFVKPIQNISILRAYNSQKTQTLAVALKDGKHKKLDQITLNGIDRCPDIGYATFFESPWDGMFMFDRLVRWVSTHA